MRTFILYTCISLFLISGLTAVNADQVNLKWDAVVDSNLGGYHLFQRVQGQQYPTTGIDTGKSTQYTVTNLLPGTTYLFVVTAYPADPNKSKESLYSNEVVAQIPPVPVGLGITTTSIPSGTVNVAYSTQLAASGGTTPYTWTFSGFPAGIVGNTNGAVSGTTSQAGTYSVIATVKDSSATIQSASKTLTLIIAPAPPSGLSIITASFPNATVGAPYSVQLSASGGVKPYLWSFCSLPSGLTGSFKDGTIKGTPIATGTYSISVSAQDSSATPLSANKAITLTIASTPQQNASSIWPATSVPKVTDEQDAAAVELGLRFKSDVAGTITGIRFYKSVANTGTHTGTLWSSSGTKLATATFTNETASGWQQVNLATPITITAGTTYVVSYHTNVGHYSADTNGLTSEVVNLPLHALANGGVYVYGSGGFPTSTYQYSNYWVDIVFK